ncbi:MAG TPA: hypothetical protein GX747_01565 [Tenericutes bacterium]|nr:hypothetical protein [Mycoplasmatota bacterium]
MINKKSLWFLTLFSLILILSVYYITMPSELLLPSGDYTSNVGKQIDNKKPVLGVEESTILVALRVEADEQMLNELDNLKGILTSVETTVDEKNNAFEKMKLINITRGEEEALEKKILDSFELQTFVKIDGDQIRVVAVSDKHDVGLANDIMRSIQENYNIKKYISVKFQK